MTMTVPVVTKYYISEMCEGNILQNWYIGHYAENMNDLGRN